jgi:tetratricopeptide (TPR) repeat protein
VPTTINGIGTYYYGKKNLQKRKGTCTECRRFTELSSYDTTLWFVVIYIPLIPLGRKHVLDECSSCHKHRVASLKDWETGCAKAIEESIAGMREKPEDPAAPIRLYQTYLLMGRKDEAEKMLAHLKDQFAADFDVQVLLGSVLESRGENAEANALYRNAHALQPDNPAARRMMGMVLLEEKNLDEALKMLDEFMEDGSRFDAGATLAAARALKAAGRNEEALSAYKLLVKRNPALKKDLVFRKEVEKAEKALGRRNSVLPPQPWYQTGWALVAGAVALGVLAFVVQFYSSLHRKVYVVSGSPKPITVSVQGGPSVTVTHGRPVEIELAEGTHTVTFSGGAQGTHTIQVSGTFLGRFTLKDVFCINAGLTAVMEWEKTVYATSSSSSTINEYTIHYGLPLFTFEDIDYPFQDFPQSISTKNSSETRTRVGMLSMPPIQAYAAFFMNQREPEALGFAEWYLKKMPPDVQLLAVYVASASQKYATRVRRYVDDRCKQRPFIVDWHRVHQDMAQNAAERTQLREEYGALLAADPENPDLLYLRSRLCACAAEVTPYREKALAKDPNHVFTLVSGTFHAAHRAEWEDAWQYAIRVQAIEPVRVGNFLEMSGYGSRHLKELETLLVQSRKTHMNDLAPAAELCRLLAWQGRDPEARQIASNFEQTFLRLKGSDPNNYGKRPLAALHYAKGDFAALDRLARQKGWEDEQTIVAVEKGDVKLLESQLAANEPTDAYNALFYSVVFNTGKNAEQAAHWHTFALSKFREAHKEEVLLKKWLSGTEAPLAADVLDLSLNPEYMVVALLAFADRFPERREEYLAALEKLNVYPEFPYHWVKRYIQSARRQAAVAK